LGIRSSLSRPVGSRLLVAASVLSVAGSVPADDGRLPFTSEAGPRGIVYQMQNFPPANGFYGFGCGFGDLDGDGDPDLVLLGKLNGLVGLFENLGDGHFVERSYSAGIPFLAGPSSFALLDFDGDGRLDLFLARVNHPARLYRNLGDWTFADVSEAAGIAVTRATKGVSAGDVDGDGWLDLYLCNYTQPGDPHYGRNILFRNRGDGTFEDIAAAWGVDDPFPSLQSVFTDFDRDGDLDLYLANDRGNAQGGSRNRLFRNDGGRFTEIGIESGAGIALDAMSAACGDLDGNGFPDLYCTNTTDAVPPLLGAFPLLLNQGDGTFVQAQHEWGVAHPSSTWGWGATFLDWDQDGRLDLYVNNQFSANSLFDFDGKLPMADLAGAVGVAGTTGASYSAAWADIDLDGDPDLLVNNLNATVRLYVNREGNRRSWVILQVVGERGNPSGIGASAELVAGGRSQFREIHMGGNSYLSVNEQVLHFGLDDATEADATVRWPSGGPVRQFRGMPANRRWTIHPPATLGDLDGDGLRSFADRVAMCSLLGRTIEPGQERVDLDGDFRVTGADLVALSEAGYAGRWEDLDGDGTVGGSDLGIVLGQWGQAGPDACLADLDGNGTVDAADLGRILAAWGF